MWGDPKSQDSEVPEGPKETDLLEMFVLKNSILKVEKVKKHVAPSNRKSLVWCDKKGVLEKIWSHWECHNMQLWNWFLNYVENRDSGYINWGRPLQLEGI